VKYDYACPACGTIKDGVPLDKIQCRCGLEAKRVREFAVNTTSLKSRDRWDPVVGAYVRNDREFNELLKQGQAAQEAELGMPVPLAQVDARDTEGLAELHGHSVDHRLEVKEQQQKIEHDKVVQWS